MARPSLLVPGPLPRRTPPGGGGCLEPGGRRLGAAWGGPQTPSALAGAEPPSHSSRHLRQGIKRDGEEGL